MQRKVLTVNGKIVLLIMTLLIVRSDALAQRPAHASQKRIQEDCRTFVQDFYDWYVPIALKDQKEPASNIAIRSKSSMFAPELLELLKRDSVAQSNATEIVGLDFDPFLNSQDPSERFVAENVKKLETKCFVTVRGYSAGKKREEITPEVNLANGRWVFVNFHYESSDLTLTSLLKKLAAERNSVKVR